MPRVAEWDVVNHPDRNTTIWDIVGRDYMAEVFAAARRAAHPDTLLFVNEDEIVRDPGGTRVEQYLRTLRDYARLGVDYDGIGFMSHFDSGRLPSITAMDGVLDRLATFGKLLQSTEFDLDGRQLDPQAQADFHRDFHTLMYSRPETVGVVMWGFWEGQHWRAGEGAALFDLDWTIRPHGRSWIDQVTSEWHTSARGTAQAGGLYDLRGYLGEYEVTAEADGVRRTVSATVSADGGLLTVRLPAAGAAANPVAGAAVAPVLLAGPSAVEVKEDRRPTTAPRPLAVPVTRAAAVHDAAAPPTVAAFTVATPASGDPPTARLDAVFADPLGVWG